VLYAIIVQDNRVNYCNALLTGLPWLIIAPIQQV